MINLQPKHIKNKIHPADAENAVHFSKCIPGTSLKSINSHVEVLIGKQRKLPFRYFSSVFPLCQGLISKLLLYDSP
jgi:hypothetical protein